MDQVVVLPLPTTPEEFLAWEVLQEDKYEFDGRAPVPMGGTREHAIIERNVVGKLWQRLRGARCQIYGSTMKIAIGAVYRYPDACVSCTPVPAGSGTVPAPVVVFEVASPSSRTTDHRIKPNEYRSLPSVQRYVMLEQRQVAATVHSRNATGWDSDTLGPGDMLRLPEIGVALPLADLYHDVFPGS